MSMLADMAGGAAPGADAAVAANAAGANGVAADGAATNGAAAPAHFYDLPDEYKDNEGVKKFVKDGKVDGAAVLKSYAHLESLNGRDKIAIPKTPEERIAARRQMGAPDDPSKYVVTRPAEMPEGMQYDEDGEKFMRQFGVENGWDQQDFDNAYKTYFERQQGMMASYQKYDKEASDKCASDLKREHGSAFDGFVQAGGVALKEFADPDFYQFLSEKGLANDPRMARIFGRIGKEMLGEGKLKGGNGGGTGTMTPAEAEAKITAFRSEHHAALFNSEHVDHKSRVEELSRLHAMKTGGK